jgi:hypothetical protein
MRTIDLEPHKAQMISWFQDENMTANEISKSLRSLYDIIVISRTIQRRLND